MEGIITARTKEGTVFQGSIWAIMTLLFFQSEFVLIDNVIEISIDGHVIPKPEYMEDAKEVIRDEQAPGHDVDA